jgi:membrane protease YdiL (CAAX protease family)
MKSLERSGGSSLTRDTGLVQQLEADARTPEDKIRVAILIGETRGAEEAAARLSGIAASTRQADVLEDVRRLQTIYASGPEALPPDDRESLMRRHGYLGRLALAYGVGKDQEPRKTLETEAFWFMVRLSALGAAIGALLLLSAGAFIVGCVWFFRGKIRRNYSPEVSSSPAYVEGFALYLVLFLGLSLLLRYFGTASLQWSWIAIFILPIVWMWVRMRGTTAEQRRLAFGWHRGNGILREIGAGLGGYVAGLVVIAAGILVTVVLVQLTKVRASSPVVQEMTGGPLRILGLYALACIFAPLAEETMFRGLLFHHMRQRWGWLASSATVSLIFAALHPQGWVAVPALAGIAMVLAALREWRGSLIAPMAAHALSNFIVLTIALLLLR